MVNVGWTGTRVGNGTWQQYMVVPEEDLVGAQRADESEHAGGERKRPGHGKGYGHGSQQVAHTVAAILHGCTIGGHGSTGSAMDLVCSAEPTGCGDG